MPPPPGSSFGDVHLSFFSGIREGTEVLLSIQGLKVMVMMEGISGKLSIILKPPGFFRKDNPVDNRFNRYAEGCRFPCFCFGKNSGRTDFHMHQPIHEKFQGQGTGPAHFFTSWYSPHAITLFQLVKDFIAIHFKTDFRDFGASFQFSYPNSE
jgi:hypothetical protein